MIYQIYRIGKYIEIKYTLLGVKGLGWGKDGMGNGCLMTFLLG